MSLSAADVLDELKSYPIAYSTEAQMQEQVEAFLDSMYLSYKREYRLSNKDIVDFLVLTNDGNLGIECKTKGQAMRIYRQVERYCQYEEIHSMLLFTSYHMALPDQINGKNCYLLKPGYAWL